MQRPSFRSPPPLPLSAQRALPWKRGRMDRVEIADHDPALGGKKPSLFDDSEPEFEFKQ